jgi:hypothetical protein
MKLVVAKHQQVPELCWSFTGVAGIRFSTVN